MLMTTACIFEDADVLLGLQSVDRLIAEERHFEALKQLRALYPAEAAILASSGQAPEPSLPARLRPAAAAPLRREAQLA